MECGALEVNDSCEELLLKPSGRVISLSEYLATDRAVALACSNKYGLAFVLCEESKLAYILLRI